MNLLNPHVDAGNKSWNGFCELCERAAEKQFGQSDIAAGGTHDLAVE